MSDTRTSHSIRTAKITFFFTFVSIVVSFLSRRFFIEGLGIEVIGLRTTIGGFLSMLNLAELGIGASIGAALYKPLFDKNHTEINEIISMQGWLYRMVALVVSLGAVVLMFFFPSLFADMKAPLWYAYAIFLVSLISTLFSYTINYKTIVLSADQKSYKVAGIMSTAGLIKSFLQMLILYYLPDPFIYWIGLDLVVSLIGVYVLEHITRREYPWLKVDLSKGYAYVKKYPQILRRTGQIFIQSVSGLVVSYATPLILFSISTLAVVGGYDNYKNFVANVRALAHAPFTNMVPGVGNLIAEGNREKLYSFFWEAHALKQLIGGICAFGLLLFASPFVALWLGSDLIIGNLALLLIVLIGYIDICRSTIDSYIVAHGLFKDVWAPLAEGAINIGVSVALGLLIGWEGVLMGSLLSVLVIVVFWKPYFLFTNAFERSAGDYWRGYAKFPLITWALIGAFYALHLWLAPALDSFVDLFIYASVLTAVFSGLLFLAFYYTSEGFRAVSKRLWVIAQGYLRRTRR